MRLSELIRKMAAAGASADVIAMAVEAVEQAEAKVEAQREAARDRKRLQRARSRDGHVTVTGQSRDSHAHPLPLSLSPQTPQTLTPTPGDIYTRAKPVCGKPNGFARFWEAYPNKVGKAAAEKAYARAVRNISGPDPPSLLLAGVERAKASRDWAEGYIPHPTTWLNQGRWEDEPTEVIPLKPRQAHERHHDNQRSAPREDRLGRMLAGAMAAVDERETDVGRGR